ncbi:squalene epoxidase-domain-containing protein [Schizophyllum amplum]|uniref:Squalene monooxygenase n=1 Tax=Schizophyllum amplum TaxID=97359 RepID=A0A550BTI6_9AGAR|nr:squalene epoxidase-domain-containing protein [Auriculariopsis ampla]
MPNSFLPPAPQYTFYLSHLPLLGPILSLLLPSSRLRTTGATRSTSKNTPIASTSKTSLNAPTPSRKRGVILVGDAYNMRHPLTGGGMTIGLHDALILSRLLGELAAPKRRAPFASWPRINDVLRTWYWQRKPLSSTIDILSVAPYDLFGAEDANLDILRTGCFKYFERGGRCVSDPVGDLELGDLIPSPLILMGHFFAVAFYAIYIMWRTPDANTGKRGFVGNCAKGVSVLHTACVVFLPLLWTEVRCWAPGARCAAGRRGRGALLGAGGDRGRLAPTDVLPPCGGGGVCGAFVGVVGDAGGRRRWVCRRCADVTTGGGSRRNGGW